MNKEQLYNKSFGWVGCQKTQMSNRRNAQKQQIEMIDVSISIISKYTEKILKDMFSYQYCKGENQEWCPRGLSVLNSLTSEPMKLILTID